MSRIRTIKPEILEDEAAAALSSNAWRLWVSMWTMADDDGRLRASDRYLRCKVFWSREDVDFHATLAELVAGNFVHLYRVRGQWFAELRNWSKHQRIEKKQKGKYPGPEEAEAESAIEDVSGGTIVTSRTIPERSGNVPGMVREDSGNVPGTFPVGRDQGREGKGGEGSGAEPFPPEESSGERVTSEQRYAEAYAEGQREAVPGSVYRPPEEPWQRGAINTFTVTDGWGKGLRGDELLAAIRQVSRDYRRAMNDDPFHAKQGFPPKLCLKWAEGAEWKPRKPRRAPTLPQDGRGPPKSTTETSEPVSGAQVEDLIRAIGGGGSAA